MTVEEIFSSIASHMLKGMMIHEQFANYYDFLGLPGYKECHEYHFLEETLSYRSLMSYYIAHHNKLIPDARIETPKMIPDLWYKHVRRDVDTTTRIGAVKMGLEKWVEWETETKKLYEDSYKCLMEQGDVASAIFVYGLIKDVDDELATAEEYLLDKEATNYDMTHIMDEQTTEEHSFKKKLKKIM